MDGVEFKDGANLDDVVLMPTGRLTREEIRKIPTNAHMLQVNIDEDGVSFAGGRFNADSKQAWINQLGDEDEAFENTTVFYVRPEKLKDPDVPLEGLATPEEIADERIRANYNTMSELEDHLDRGEVDADGIRAMLIVAVEQGRKGLVQNPF